MQLSQRQVDIINTLYNQNLNLAKGDDDQRRSLTKMIVEQFQYEVNHGGWGMKARDKSSPASKDTIAYYIGTGPSGDIMDLWDWQNGSSREPQIHVGDGPTYPSSLGYFIQVQPINHLAAPIPNPIPEEDVIVIVKRIDENQKIIMQALPALIEAVNQIKDIVSTPHEIPPIKFPEYEGSVLGFKATLRPKQ